MYWDAVHSPNDFTIKGPDAPGYGRGVASHTLLITDHCMRLTGVSHVDSNGTNDEFAAVVTWTKK
jgi:hypothetical protein